MLRHQPIRHPVCGYSGKHSASGVFPSAKRLHAPPIKPEDGQPWSGGMAMKMRRRGEDDPRRRSPLGLAQCLGPDSSLRATRQ